MGMFRLNSLGTTSTRNVGKPGAVRDKLGNIRNGAFGQLQNRPYQERGNGGRKRKHVCHLVSNTELAKIQRKFNSQAVCEAVVYKPVKLDLNAAAKALPQ